MDYVARLAKVERSVEASGFDAFLVTHLANVRYMCGFTGSSGVLAFAHGKWAFFTDGRYTTQARTEVKGAKVIVGRTAPLAVAAGWVGKALNRSRAAVRIGIESEHTTIAMKARIEAELRGLLPSAKCRLIPTNDIVEQLRIRKSADEIRLIRAAVNLASSIFPKVHGAIREGITENEVAGELEHLARRAGAEKMSFETIVAAGRRSALPHARPSQSKVGKGFVVLDYGVILGGYCSDMTRTVCVGRPTQAARNMYSAVLEAQLAGISAVRAGALAHEVDSTARSVLKGHKLDRYFTHSLGHGVGIEIHEAPRLAKGQTQTLEAGMIVTIEPGVYIADRGGVRIEDMVLVTANGCEVLTPTPKELVTC